MAHYLIYIGGVQGASDEHLRRVGLGDLLHDRGAEWADALANTPDGRRGMLATWTSGNSETDPYLTFRPSQEWTAAEANEELGLAAGRFWIGVDRERPVTPADLARPHQHQGHWMELADGNAWLVPAAIKLPHKYKLNRQGQPQRVIVQRHQEFYDLAQRHMTQIFEALDLLDYLQGKFPERELSADPVPIPIEDGVRFCWMALALNYRLNPDVISALGLLDDQSLQKVIAGAIDLPDILETRDAKKNYSPVGIPVG